MTRKIVASLALMISTVVTLITLTTTPSYGTSPYGIWSPSDNGAHVKVFSCQGGLGMKVASSKISSIVGKTIMCGAKKRGRNVWAGQLLNLKDGKIYKGKVVVKGNKMSIQGCVLGGLICKSDTWKRLR